jgi:predicted ABC-type exoprotein transport system permease subunit
MMNAEGPHVLEPVQSTEGEADSYRWPHRLRVFLRAMATISLCKGLYHWAVICGIGAPLPSGFDAYSTPYQVATVFFAVIDLVAGVGLWLAAPWGAVVWLTSVISMAAVELLFPQIYGGNTWVVVVEVLLLATYLWLALMAAREQPG